MSVFLLLDAFLFLERPVFVPRLRLRTGDVSGFLLTRRFSDVAAKEKMMNAHFRYACERTFNKNAYKFLVIIFIKIEKNVKGFYTITQK